MLLILIYFLMVSNTYQIINNNGLKWLILMVKKYVIEKNDYIYLLIICVKLVNNLKFETSSEQKNN